MTLRSSDVSSAELVFLKNLPKISELKNLINATIKINHKITLKILKKLDSIVTASLLNSVGMI